MSRTVLITSTTWWPGPARVAMALAHAGVTVAALAPAGHPLRHTAAVDRIFRYRALAPLLGLRAAIAAVTPELVIPGDDRAVAHLHALHAHPRTSPDERALIEHSLGSAAAYPVAASRCALLDLAREVGVPTPDFAPLAGAEDLRPWAAGHPFPWVLKVDGSWGGTGVAIVRDWAEAQTRFAAMARPPAGLSALKRLLVNRDPFQLATWLARAQSAASVQAFIPGRPANSLVACWQGEVLAELHVESVAVQSATGPATAVRIIDHPGMAAAARKLVGSLGISGFCGFDFLLEDVGNAALLIEMNPRFTQITHLDCGPGRDPVAALSARVLGAATSAAVPISGDMVAFFPQAWRADPATSLLHSAWHDVPWEEPDLVRELIRPGWTERGVLARLYRRVRGRG